VRTAGAAAVGKRRVGDLLHLPLLVGGWANQWYWVVLGHVARPA